MSETTLYTIGELADMAGVTPRTIRYYTAEGLMPKPDARGHYALYSEDHLLRLKLIARLKEAYLPLGEIRARITQLDDQQIRQLLEQDAEPHAPEQPSSASDYLSHVLTQQLPAANYRKIAEQREAFALPQQQLSPPKPPATEAAPAPSAPAYGFAAPAAAPQSPSLLRKLIPQRHNQAVAPEPGAPVADAPPPPLDRWQHVQLAPGVELHIREPTAPRLQERIAALLALARDLFREEE